jgi:hypothetical protein
MWSLEKGLWPSPLLLKPDDRLELIEEFLTELVRRLDESPDGSTMLLYVSLKLAMNCGM